MDKVYIAIDLKSFYASVECFERGLDPLKTNLVVADKSRTEKTICLAVTPSLKAYGISGRARLFEVVEKVKQINAQRLAKAPGRKFTGSSFMDDELKKDPGLELDYIAAPPRMSMYMKYSSMVYNVYLKYIAPEDILVYSIDEVFIDATSYLSFYGLTAHELAMKMILDVLSVTGVTATAGIGTNLYLAKIAMDIYAKKMKPDENGVRIAALDEMSYRRELWTHRPITDFWRVGHGYARKLEKNGLYTMGDIARCSLGKPWEFHNEDLLYKLFGINAELLIDHAWGWEPVTLDDIRAYRPKSRSLSSGQVLMQPYEVSKARIVALEMADAMVLDLVEKHMVTDQMVLTIGYDIQNLQEPERLAAYKGKVRMDRYGRRVPEHAHGSVNLGGHTSSTQKILDAVMQLYDRIADPALLIRRLNITANNIMLEEEAEKPVRYEQMDLFTDYEALERQKEAEQARKEKEKSLQKAVIGIKKRYGKNAILKGTDLQEGATMIERNSQIGGHKS